MKRFQNVLFVIEGLDIPEKEMEQALSVIVKNDSKVAFMVVHAGIPGNLAEIEKTYEAKIIEVIKTKLHKSGYNRETDVFFNTDKPFFVSIIQYVIRQNFDLVIKKADTDKKDGNRGLRSIDMSLLRKCPCPVWLWKDQHEACEGGILTAVDPQCETREGYDLNNKLLQIGSSLAAYFETDHTVISCWDFEHENFLRHSPFAKIEDKKVDALILDEKQSHETSMEKLLKESDIPEPSSIQILKGKASERIPEYVEEKRPSILVMGTVARTGIPGFIIGNTAENILQNVLCSMFTAKPNGFISPIKAY